MTGEVQYFTMLRDPIERAISHYFFIRQPNAIPGHNNFNAAQRAVHEITSLAEIFDRNRKHKYRLTSTWLVDNMQTRYIAGYTHYALPKNSNILLRRAKKNLRSRYRAFGLTEAYQESLERLNERLGFMIGEAGAKRKSTSIEKIVTEEDRLAIKENNLLDLELYSYAQELFRQG